MNRSLALLAVTATLCGSASASTINWGSPTNISGDSDVNTVGTLVEAWNLSAGGVPGTTTINGVSFSNITTCASVAGSAFSLGPGGLCNNDGPAPPLSSLSAAYQDLLLSNLMSNADVTLSIFGLSPGDLYIFEWWSTETNITTPGYLTTATAGNSVTLNPNTSDATGGVGQFAGGTFTADGTGTETITFSSPGSTYYFVNGFQLRDAPEPSSLALLALGILGLAARRKVLRDTR